MKTFSRLVWDLYKHSEAGQKMIEQFKAVTSAECSGEEMLALAKKCNPRCFSNFGDGDDNNIINFYDNLRQFFCESIAEEDKQLITHSEQEMEHCFQWSLKVRIEAPIEASIDELPQNIFKYELWWCAIASWALYSVMPNAFIPNLFAFQFNYLSRFANRYEIDLPPVPNRSAYKDRCMYYVQLNRILWEYAMLNGITDPAEVCAFWFGLALPLAKEEIDGERNDLPSIPEQAWLLVGNYSEDEKRMTVGYWQANPMTARGDVLMFYEKSPVKKMNAAWIAQEDGVADPFFHFYGYTLIGDKIVIPEDQTLTFDDFKASDYFKTENRGSKGNFVSKNFQDCSGWPIPFNDYAEIK